jgi:hypothetical protein
MTMKYGIECPVTSTLRLAREISAVAGGFTYVFKAGSEGYLSQLTVIADVPNPATVSTRRIINQEQRKLVVQINTDKELHAAMMLTVQSIESVLGFYFSIDNIHWNRAEAFIEVENEVEGLQIEVPRWGVYQGVGEIVSQHIDEAGIRAVINTAEACKSLTPTLAFYREGANDMRSLRFVSAFFNFYFVLEGLFGNGKTKNDGVEAEFRRSKKLIDAIQNLIDQGLPKSYGEDESIIERLEKANKPCNPESIVKLLVSIRGNLHHYAGNPRRPGGSPLTQARYCTVAMFCMQLCQIILQREIISRESSS